jgi:hypothetical protein
MQLETQKIRDQAIAFARPIGKAAVSAGLSARQSARSGLEQALEASHDLQAQLERLLSRRRSQGPRKEILIAGGVLLVAGVGAAVLLSAPVRRAVRGQADRLRERWRDRKAEAAGRDHEDDLLDQRIDASFPASDPVGANHVN